MVKQTPLYKLNKKRKNGQVLVELALSIPFLLLIIFGIIYFGRLFYIKQVLLIACQSTAQLASQYPNLNDPNVRDNIRGFTVSGQTYNINSPNYNAFSASYLLSNGNSGNLPNGSSIYLLPFDTNSVNGIQASPNSVSVVIEYPMNIFGNNQNLNIWQGNGSPLTLPSFTVTEYASFPLLLNQN